MAGDRKFCPICKQKCHHDASLTPKQKIDPGYGGIESFVSNPKIEHDIVAV